MSQTDASYIEKILAGDVNAYAFLVEKYEWIPNVQPL